MSEADIRSKISAKEDDITKVEELASKKEADAGKSADAEYDPKIADVSSKFEAEQKLLDEATEKYNTWKAKMEEKKAVVKDLSRQLSSLKSGKEKGLKTNLKAIEKEKKTNIKVIQKEIKALNKELSALEKASQA